MNNIESNNNVKQAVLILKALSDITRIKIIQCIYKQKRNVKDIATNTKMTHSAISHQLKILKDANLVSCQRNGKEIFYSLRDEHVKTIVKQVFQHLECEA